MKDYGLTEALTEENFKEQLTQLKDRNDNGIVRLSIGSLLDQLTMLKSYKDGIVKYTDGVGEAADGAGKLSDGVRKLKKGTDKLVDKYFDSMTLKEVAENARQQMIQNQKSNKKS